MLEYLGNVAFHVVVFIAAALYIEQNVRVRVSLAKMQADYKRAAGLAGEIGRDAKMAGEAVVREAKKIL